MIDRAVPIRSICVLHHWWIGYGCMQKKTQQWPEFITKYSIWDCQRKTWTRRKKKKNKNNNGNRNENEEKREKRRRKREEKLWKKHITWPLLIMPPLGHLELFMERQTNFKDKEYWTTTYDAFGNLYNIWRYRKIDSGKNWNLKKLLNQTNRVKETFPCPDIFTDTFTNFPLKGNSNLNVFWKTEKREKNTK